MHGYGFGMWGMGFWGMLIFCVGGLLLVAWTLRAIVAPRDQRNESSAMQILEERFAKGEINKKEYLAMKETLSK